MLVCHLAVRFLAAEVELARVIIQSFFLRLARVAAVALVGMHTRWQLFALRKISGENRLLGLCLINCLFQKTLQLIRLERTRNIDKCL